MALPNKKQLNTHKRGTKKALDTLDALENLDEEVSTHETEEKPVKKKPAKKTSKKATKKTKKPKSEKKPAPKKVEKLDLILDEQEIEDKIEASGHGAETDSTPEPGDTVPDESSKPSGAETDINPPVNIDLSEGDRSTERDVNDENGTRQSAAKSVSIAKEDETVSGDSQQANPKEIEEDIDAVEDTQKDRYLTFRIGKEDYGIEIMYVTEIIVMQRITEVPETPSHIRGVINLRGMVIPVMDVRQRFSIEPKEYDDRTCIVVVDFEELAVGLIVDVVNEVVDIPEKDIDPPPSAYAGIQQNYIRGMGKVGKKVKILLDIECVLDRNSLK